MGRTLISSEHKPISRELAQWLYGLRTVPRERSIKPARLAQLKADINSGNIIPFRWVYATLNGENYRVNGQHTSYMFQNGTAIPPGAVCSLEHYACETLDDVCELWALYDSQISSRTRVEVTTNFQHARDAIKDCRGKTVQLCQGALAIERFGFGYTNKVSMNQKLDCVRSNEDFVVWADAFMGASYLLRVGVVYAMLKTYRKAGAESSAFWQEVVDGTNPDPFSGSRQLQVFLLSTAANTGQGARSSKQKSSWYETATVAITCWNYWRTRKPIKKLMKSKEMPDAI